MRLGFLAVLWVSVAVTGGGQSDDTWAITGAQELLSCLGPSCPSDAEAVQV